MSLTLYHNPRCSKSRQTLALIQAAGIEPEIRLYLKDPLNSDEVTGLLTRLDLPSARALMRKGEADYKAQNLDAEQSESNLISAICQTPKLMERPIVDDGTRAIIGRPPENVQKLLKS